MPWIIYKAICATGKSYIGLTKQCLAVRWQHHVFCAFNGWAKKHGMVIGEAIKEHGAASFVVTKISTHRSMAAASKAERRAIRRHNTLIPNGYNVAFGSWSIRKKFPKWTPEARKRHSVNQRGRVISKAARKRMSEAAKAKTFSKIHRERIGDASRGKPNYGVALAGLLRTKKGNTTKTPGGRWMARIKTAGVTAYIGTYDTKRESIAAYNVEREKRITTLRGLIARRALTAQQRRNLRIALDREKWLRAHQ